MVANLLLIVYRSQVFESNAQEQNLKNIICINREEMDANCLKISK